MPDGDPEDGSALVLVEGRSDRAAVAALLARLPTPTDAVTIVSMEGATNIAHHLDHLGPDVARVAVLCDANERDYVMTAIGEVDEALDLLAETVALFVCDRDLEEELIRATGIDAMVDFIDRQGELRPFRTLQKQPAQRDRTVEHHVHRFCGVRSGRKQRYARGLAEELDLDALPPPLAMLTEWICD